MDLPYHDGSSGTEPNGTGPYGSVRKHTGLRQIARTMRNAARPCRIAPGDDGACRIAPDRDKSYRTIPNHARSGPDKRESAFKPAEPVSRWKS